jgi:hypothetical protein
VIAVVLLDSSRRVPSEINVTTNLRAVVVPVARVPVEAKPVPKVTVRETVPLVTITTLAVVPAGGTVVVSVVFAEIVT